MDRHRISPMKYPVYGPSSSSHCSFEQDLRSSTSTGNLNVTSSTAGSCSNNKLAVVSLPEGPSIPHRRCDGMSLRSTGRVVHGGGGTEDVWRSVSSDPPCKNVWWQIPRCRDSLRARVNQQVATRPRSRREEARVSSKEISRALQSAISKRTVEREFPLVSPRGKRGHSNPRLPIPTIS
jgi:hypothetical protein